MHVARGVRARAQCSEADGARADAARRRAGQPRRGLIAAGALGSVLALALGASAQSFQAPGPVQAQPDPNAWWTADEPRPEEAVDPLGPRRWSKRDAQVRRGFTNGVDASLYRLWGLQPLQSLALRRSEAIYELWFRPTDSTRQAVIRIILRADGEAFVQARAGRGCCSPEIARRVDINVQLTPEQRRALLRLRDDPTWNQPRNVVVSEGEGVVSSVCVDGASYDLTLLDDRRAVHLRRSCDPAEIGSAAAVIQPIVEAARGRDARFDAVFAEQRLDRHAQSYAQLLEVGGRIRATSEDTPNTPPPPPPEFANEREEAEQAILAADRAFAARASAGTAAQAFREFMDGEDGLVLSTGGEPIEGAEAIYRHFGAEAPEAGKLLWEPVQAWASESGDFGASWGRSSYVPNGSSGPARAHGYLTVWRRDAEGKWKGLVDVGLPANAPAGVQPGGAVALTGGAPAKAATPPVRPADAR